MTNKERYQRTFSALHASEDFLTEVNQMKHTAKNGKKRIVALVAAVAIIAVLATAAYAADVGGIRRTVQIWLHGDQTDAVLEVNQNADATTEYSLTYTDENGKTRHARGDRPSKRMTIAMQNRQVLTRTKLIDTVCKQHNVPFGFKKA